MKIQLTKPMKLRNVRFKPNKPLKIKLKPASGSKTTTTKQDTPKQAEPVGG